MSDSLTPPGAVSRRRAATGLMLALSCGLFAACGAGGERPPPAPAEDDLNGPDLSNYDSSTADARDSVAAGVCENGTTQVCRVYLPAHDGIQPCFVGEQTCVNEQWGACADAVLVDANAGDAALDPGDTPSP